MSTTTEISLWQASNIFDGLYHTAISSITDYEDEFNDLDSYKAELDSKIEAGLTPFEIEHFKTLGLDLTDFENENGKFDFDLYKKSRAGQSITDLHCDVYKHCDFAGDVMDIYNKAIMPDFVNFINYKEID